jgi:X-X-X-Leu-X-X-Gly heptad repeat protein
MDSASELADGVADLADGVSELADGVATKHGTALHGARLARTTRCTKKMQLSAKLGYIHCDAEDVIACAAHPGVVPLVGARRRCRLEHV